MSLYGYKKKHKPALWVPSPPKTWDGRVLKPKKKAVALWVSLEKATTATKDSIRRRRSRTPQQKKALADRAAYRKRVKEWLVGKQCVGCLLASVAAKNDFIIRRATQCHHKHGRRGALLLYEPLWLPVCGPCHDWIHKNIEAARYLGLYAPAGQWERMPP